MSSASATTVTFLFTDIEGSTRLWQDHPDAMPEALARHDAIARDAVASQGGRLFKHTGDGVCAAFADAPAALDAAVAMQRALAAAAWGTGPRPRVRMALDSGPAQCRDGDYFGPTLNRTARVLAVGAGGQILATAATVALAPGAAAVDLGDHRLRDLGEPVRIHQIVAADLERAFPPLRSLDRYRHSLPVVRSSFVGREAEIARLRDLLGRKRLLTITGVGGCGKTRLALAVATHELERFADGVFFVDLSAVHDAALVWSAVSGAIGADVAGPGVAVSPRDGVLRRLRDAAALVVLDNCEHLLDGCADVADALVGGVATASILATSREPLGVEGEQVYRVPSLDVGSGDDEAVGSEAVRLFAERAAAADAGFVLTPPLAPVVAEICRRLDGIPLAIELAAARVRHLSVDEIARRLDDRFRLLTGGPRGARQRQQTLAAALDWSFHLLAERERILLRRCAVFVDGFSLEAAEGVCGGDGLPREEVVDVLGALVDKSLVALHASERRYRLLETIRLYALDRLVDAGEAPGVRDRHVAWYLAAYAAPGDPAMPRTCPDLGNLRAARLWAHDRGDGEGAARLTLALFWQRVAFDPATFAEREWSHAAIADPSLPPALRAELLAVASTHDVGAGRWDEAIEHARDAIGQAAEPGSGAVGGAYVAMAIALMVRDADAAERVIDEGVAQVRRASAPVYTEAFLASMKIGTALMRGDPRAALDVAGRLGFPRFIAAGSMGIPFAMHLLGDHAAAEAHAAASPGAGMGLREHGVRLLLALTSGAQGRWDDAGRHLEAAVALVRRHPYPLTLNDCVIVCGALAAIEGRFERAAALLASVADRDYVRSPETWAVYLHYRRLVRAALDPATIRRCRDDAKRFGLDAALDEELRRRRA